ncbi:MAG TPA: hypothetical protein VGK73_17570 [Polyangiaceae bacterium]
MKQSLDIDKGTGAYLGKVVLKSGGRGIALHPENARLDAKTIADPDKHPSPNRLEFDVVVLPGGARDVLLHGSLWFNIPSGEVAEKLAQLIRLQADRVEQEENARTAVVNPRPGAAYNIVGEQALAIRGGLPFDLTGNREIMALARTEARDNRDLRRFIPSSGNLAGLARLGLPTVRQFSAVPAVAAREQAALMTPDEKRALARQLEEETNGE